MLRMKFGGSIKIINDIPNTYIKATLRFLSNTETLEPVKLSYATYESAVELPGSQASALMVLHGLFGSKANWNSLCKVYQQKTDPKRKIIAVDARNHGDSPHNDNHTYTHMAADVRALMKHLELDKVTLMGHSMGGRTAMLFSLKYPELVDRLIVADISPVRTSPHLESMPELFKAVQNTDLPLDVSLSKARTLVDSQLAKTISDKDVRAFILTNLVQGENRSYKWRLNLPVLSSHFSNIAKFPLVNEVQYTGPVLFVGGEDSDFIRSKSAQQRYLLQAEDNLDLAYSSYELTKSYSPVDPEPTLLVILHGLMDSKSNWNSFCKRYHNTSTNKVLALDARNHGDSPHSCGHSYDDLVVDIRRFMHKRNINKINLLGHSMGGRAAMLFALKYPDLVEKLIVADISPITTSSNLKQMTKLLAALKNMKLPKDVPLSQARKQVHKDVASLVKNNTVASLLLTNLVQKPDGSYTWRFNITALLSNFEGIATFPEIHHIAYDGPVLFVGGAKSDYIHKSDFPKILKLFPNAELKFIEGAGHWLHSEKPAEFLQLTLEFLNRKPADR